MSGWILSRTRRRISRISAQNRSAGGPAAGIVEAVGDHQKVRHDQDAVGRVLQYMLVEPLTGSGLAAVLVAGTPRGDDVGADAHVDELHRMALRSLICRASWLGQPH